MSSFENYFIKEMGHFFRVYIASSKYSGAGRFLACERRHIFSVTGSDNVCQPELENDFCDVGILSQSQFSSEKPRTTARGIRASQENKVQQQWRIMWMLLSVKFAMFLGSFIAHTRAGNLLCIRELLYCRASSCEEYSSFILSCNMIGQLENKSRCVREIVF